MPLLPKTIRYTDIDGKPAEATYHFMLTKAELMEMELLHQDDVEGYFRQIIANKDGAGMIRIWKDLLMRAVGKREGPRIVKNDDIRAEFEQTGAYDEMFFELIQSPDGGAEFFMKILPEDLQEQAEAQKNRVFTDEEKLAMSDEEFAIHVGTDLTKMSKHDLALAMRRRGGGVDGPVRKPGKNKKKRRPTPA